MQEDHSCDTINKKVVKRLQEERNMRRTKIICTLGPSTDQGDVMETLVRKGWMLRVSIFRTAHTRSRKSVLIS